MKTTNKKETTAKKTLDKGEKENTLKKEIKSKNIIQK